MNTTELRSRFEGKGDLLRRLIRILGEQTPQLLGRLRLAARNGDARGVEGAAHTLRGSLMQFGAHDAAELAHQLEQAAGDGAIGQAEAAIDELKLHTDEIQQVLNNLANSPDL